MENGGIEVLQESGPELSPLGKRIELLRIERGISKQLLARHAGTSRQQLWRVMTGKSDLTSGLCRRLAEVLQVDPGELREWCGLPAGRVHPPVRPAGPPPLHRSLAEYGADPDAVLRTLDTLPTDAAGRRLRRELLNCIEVVAADAGLKLSPAFFELRGRVINGEL